MKDDIIVIVVEPGCFPYYRRLENSVEAMQELLGGPLEIYSPEPGTAIVMLQDAMANEGTVLNRGIRNYKGSDPSLIAYSDISFLAGTTISVIGGIFLLCGLDESGFCTLPDQKMEALKSRFYYPETFIEVYGRLEMLRMKPLHEVHDML